MNLQKIIQLADKVNIAKDLDDDAISKIGQDVVRLTRVDDNSRSKWMKLSKDAMKLALQVKEGKNTPWEGASNIKYPIITVAALQFHARAYPAIVSGNQVVKYGITGADPDGEKAARGKRISDHMNYQLLEQDQDWEEETDKLLLALAIEGCEFKKTYFDSDRGHNRSEWVRPIDLIVNYKTKTLATCPRVTHRVWFYPYEIDLNVESKLWLDANLAISPTDYEDEVLQEFYEQHVWLRLPKYKHKLPFIVTVHVDSQQVVRITPGFDKEDLRLSVKNVEGTFSELMKSMAQEGLQEEQVLELMSTAELLKVNRNEYFTKIPFIGSPDGGFYDIGFGQLVGPLSDTVDTIINQLIDAGTFENNATGFKKANISLNKKQGHVNMVMGQFIEVDMPSSGSIKDAIYEMKHTGPSLVLFNLLGFIVGASKEITGIQDIMSDTAGANEPVGTAYLRVEQGLKFFTSIYKRIHRGIKRELQLLYKLNSKYLQVQEYFSILESSEQGVVTLSDYTGDPTDVQPVSDAQLASSIIKVAKAQALMALRGSPSVNSAEIERRYIEALEIPDAEKIMTPQQPQPDPDLLLKAQIAASEHMVNRGKVAGLYAKALSDIANAESTEQGQQLETYKTYLEGIMNDYGSGQGGMAGNAANESGGQVPGEPQAATVSGPA